MPDIHDTGFWEYVGQSATYVCTAVVGIVSGAGTIIGINKKRSVEGESVPANDLEKLKDSLSEAVSRIEKTEFFVSQTEKAMDKYNNSIERVHARLDEILHRIASLEGFNEGHRKVKD